MIYAKHLPYQFREEEMNSACHIQNRVTIRPGTKVTHYELRRGRNPNVKYFHVFGNNFYVITNHEQRKKLGLKSDEDIFLGYSINNSVY